MVWWMDRLAQEGGPGARPTENWLTKRTGELMKAKHLTLISGVLLVAALAFFWRGSRVGVSADAPAMLREIQRLNELVTVKYSIQKVVGLEEQKRPVGSEKLLLIVQAKVLAGVDLAALSSADVIRVRTGELLVRLPAAQILHVVVDEKSTKVWDRQVTWWTPWVPYNQDLERQARVAALESIRESAMEMGILVDAQANARSSIRRLLEAVGIRQVSFAPAS